MTETRPDRRGRGAHAALHATRDQPEIDYQSMLDSMTDGVMTVTPDGRVGIVNAAGAGILGREAEILRGSRLSDMAAADPDAGEFVDAILGTLTAPQTGRRHTISYRRRGEARRLSIATALLDPGSGAEPGHAGLVSVFADVTEMARLRDAEIQLNASLQEEHGKLQDAYRELEQSGVNLQHANRRLQLLRLGATVGIFLLFAAAAGVVFVRSANIGMLSTAASPVETGAQTITVEPQPLQLQISAVGTVEAGSVVALVAPFDGQIKEKRFSYGGAVERGEILAVMDTGDLEDRLRDAQSALIKARQRMNELQNWSSGIEMSRARRAVTSAQLDVDTLKGKLKETKMLLDKGIVSRGEYTDLDQQMRARQLQLDDAQQDLAATAARGDAAQQRIAALELATAQAKAQGLESDLEKAKLAAPVSGVVLQPPEESGSSARREKVEVGTRVVRGQGIVTIGDLEDFTVKASIDEIDINKVRVGQTVEVTSESFEGESFSGKVTSVGAQAGQDPTGRSGMPVFPINVAVDTSPEERRSVRVGMSAALSIVTYDQPEAIVLPPGAVHGAGDHATVDVRGSNGEVHAVPVKLGVTAPSGIEIREGLAAGDVVVVGH
ncbi:MAG TPA: HlyD family efflux transporter periplasmic adaptor subunit [Stellaceae bacterium]|nr:HlyD family efflux transporter periplasmic adaptor subunit [Stellaceae bacterium]